MQPNIWKKGIFSLLLSLLFLGTFFSCSDNAHEACILNFKWHNADALAASYLLYDFADSSNMPLTDTLFLTEKKGHCKVRLPIYTFSEIPLTIYNTQKTFSIPLLATRERKITISFDARYPSLYRAKGYEAINTRDKFIKKEEKKLRTLVDAQRAGDRHTQQTLWQEIWQDAAIFISRTGNKKGTEMLANEFFPGPRGAARYLQYAGLDTIPRHLLRLNNDFSLYQDLQSHTHLQAVPSGLVDSMNNIEKVSIMGAYFLVSFDMRTPQNTLKKSVEQWLRADTTLYYFSLLADSTRESPVSSAVGSQIKERYCLLHPHKSDWLRSIVMNGVDTLPYYFVVSKSMKIVYHGNNADSIGVVVDSLRKRMPAIVKPSF